MVFFRRLNQFEQQISLAEIRWIVPHCMISFWFGLTAMVILVAECTVFLASSVLETIKFIICLELATDFVVVLCFDNLDLESHEFNLFSEDINLFVMEIIREVKSHHQFAKLDFVNVRQWMSNKVLVLIPK